MNANQFKAWLAKQGCTFEAKKGGSGHLIVRRGDRKTDLPPTPDRAPPDRGPRPMHGGKKQLGTGLMSKIRKELGLG